MLGRVYCFGLRRTSVAPLRGLLTTASGALEAQRGGLFPWVPVCLATGIGGYFALPAEPGVWGWALAGGTLALGLAAVAAGAWRRPWAVGLVLILFGLCWTGARAHLVAAPVLDWRYYGPVEGRIVAVDRSVSDKVRLTLDRVVLGDVARDRTPGRVRVSLHGRQDWIDPRPGATVILTAHLGPPQGPVEPGGFDFQRMAWFSGLGAVGYTRSPVLEWAPAGRTLPVARLRMAVSSAVRAALPGEAGAFAAAITTGDRSAIEQGTMQDLRDANLAHLLAISGLHMGLLTAFVFGAIRLGLAAVPGIALIRPIKKWAALGALAAATAYLALSGGNVATQRAFIMVAVMLGAVLMDRRALTLRAVAVAAVIVLLWRPEALIGPGFQMSFAATVALVAVFRLIRDRAPGRLPRWARPVAAVVVSSAVAGAATAPIAAAHFNQIASYGLIANLLTVPLMGTLVMPAAVLAACLAPLGLAWLGLQAMAPPIHWILGVAHRVADLDGALRLVPTPPGWVLPVLALGALWIVLWSGRARAGGAAVAAAALIGWAGVERPALLIGADAGLIGVMTPEGRALSKQRGSGFAAASWLENDGDGADQAAAAAREGIGGARPEQRFSLGPVPVRYLSGKGAVARLSAVCVADTVVVVAAEVDDPAAPCLLIDQAFLRRTGAVAMDLRPDGSVALRAAKEVTGRRLWNTPRRRAGSVAAAQ
ncbi:ComEC family competence protein [Rhodobacteraceae bacterium CCMM004]|nr:ComEC family competence protein [Rhodobacteraceae bacterium CCMM004]